MNDARDLRRTLDQQALAIERLREEIRQVRMVLVAHATDTSHRHAFKGRYTRDLKGRFARAVSDREA